MKNWNHELSKAKPMPTAQAQGVRTSWRPCLQMLWWGFSGLGMRPRRTRSKPCPVLTGKPTRILGYKWEVTVFQASLWGWGLHLLTSSSRPGLSVFPSRSRCPALSHMRSILRIRSKAGGALDPERSVICIAVSWASPPEPPPWC